MDFMAILKDAWQVTWRHRTLWVLGLFLGGSAGSVANWRMDSSDLQRLGGGNAGSGWTTTAPDTQFVDFMKQAVDYLEATAGIWLPWVIAGVAVLLVIGVAAWVLSVAARGGLAYETNEALAKRDVTAMHAWRIGFRFWGRVFLVGFLLTLPAVLAGLLAFLLAAGTAAMITFGGATMSPLGVGVLVFLPLLVLVAVAAAVLASLLIEVATRRAVLDDEGAVSSIKAAWSDLWGRRGVLSMWLVMIIVGIVAALLSAVFVLPIAFLFAAVVVGAAVTTGPFAVGLIVPLLLVLFAAALVFKAVYSTFTQAAWTSFYVRMQAPLPEPAEA